MILLVVSSRTAWLLGGMMTTKRGCNFRGVGDFDPHSTISFDSSPTIVGGLEVVGWLRT